MNYVMDSETAKGMIDDARKAFDAIDSIECTSKDYECRDCIFDDGADSVVRCMYDALKQNLREMEGE